MKRKMPIFYSALVLTGVNLLLRLVSTSFQVYLSGRIGAGGIGLLQLVLSVGALSMTLGMAGARTATMYLTAEELGTGRAKNVRWVLSGCVCYSFLCSSAVALGLSWGAPFWHGCGSAYRRLQRQFGYTAALCLCFVCVGS